MRQYIEYLKIPYLHEGRDSKGADCFGLMILFYKQEFGIELPDFKGYAEEWWLEKNYFLEMYKDYNFHLIDSGYQFGDVILFRNTNTHVGHSGIILDDTNFIHMTRSGCCIGNYRMGAWHRQVHSVYRYKESGE